MKAGDKYRWLTTFSEIQESFHKREFVIESITDKTPYIKYCDIGANSFWPIQDIENHSELIKSANFQNLYQKLL